MRYKILLFAFFVLSAISTIAQQYTFEGYRLLLHVPENHTSAACAIRYVPPSTQIDIVDLNPSSRTRIRPCPGSNTQITLTPSGQYKMQALDPSGKWCFQGEDRMYKLNFIGDAISNNANFSYIWIANKPDFGNYNVKEFGAKGDGITDDTLAIQSALAYIASRNGGVLQFPEGDFVVISPIVLPAGITIQGVGSLATGAPTNNMNQRAVSRIRLEGRNKSLFKIGECTERVAISDIELYAKDSINTIGIEGIGAFNSSQDLFIERVTFNNFYRGIYIRGLSQTNQGWQFDYIKIKHCRFINNKDSGIYSFTRNAGWKIEGCVFINPPRSTGQQANSMTFYYAGFIQIQDTFGGGFPSQIGGAFISIVDSGEVTVIGSQTESMTYSFIYNEPNLPGHGDYSYPITFINNIFGDKIEFRGRRTLVSIGNLYDLQTFTMPPSVRVYSLGDRFCYDGFILGCVTSGLPNFDNATVIFRTGQPGEGSVSGYPTTFNHDVEINTGIKLPATNFSTLPTKPNFYFVYCTDCQRNTSPCAPGGTGALAIRIGTQWNCL